MWIVWIVDCGLWIVTGLRSQLSAQSVRAEGGEGKVPMGECGAGREGKERKGSEWLRSCICRFYAGTASRDLVSGNVGLG
jgi:hypothetical protein